MHLGAVLYNQRKLDAAKVHLDRALEIEPTSSLALYELARVERAQGQVDAAVKDLEKVVRDDPDWLSRTLSLSPCTTASIGPEDGAREKQIVDRLAEEQERQSKSPIITPRTPSP